MNKLEMDRWMAGKASAHAQADVPVRGSRLEWKWPRGEPVELGRIPDVVARALGLVAVSVDADGLGYVWMKPEDSDRPDSVLEESLVRPRQGPIAKDRSSLPAGGTAFDGLRLLVAGACRVELRKAGRREYYGLKYADFVKMISTEAALRQKAAALAAKGEK